MERAADRAGAGRWREPRRQEISATRDGGERACAEKEPGGKARAGRAGGGAGAAQALLTRSPWRLLQKIALQLKATLENVTNLRPVGEDFRWYLKVRLEGRGSGRLGCRLASGLWWGRQGPARVKLSHPDLSSEQELSLGQDEKSLLNVLFSPG